MKRTTLIPKKTYGTGATSAPGATRSGHGAGRRLLWERCRTAVTLLAVLAFFCIQSAGVTASQETRKKLEDAKNRRAETQQQLEEAGDSIDQMSDERQSLRGELENLNTQLNQVSNNLETLESNISSKEEDIAQTQAELTEARRIEDEQYHSMKMRIQFIYEHEQYVLTEMLLGAQSFAEFLNQSAYIEAMSAYDRKMLNQYQQTRAMITEKEAQLQRELEELNDYHAQEKAEQQKVSGLVRQTSGTIASYDNRISTAEEEARMLRAELEEQQADVEALEKKLKEEIRLSQLARQSKWRDISEVHFEENDKYLIANMIYCEAGGEPYEGQVAVGAVIINRVRSSVFPNTVTGVLYQRSQFSPVKSGRFALALAENRATASCYRAAEEAMSGYSNVGDRIGFRTPIPGLTGIRIGGHIFF